MKSFKAKSILLCFKRLLRREASDFTDRAERQLIKCRAHTKKFREKITHMGIFRDYKRGLATIET